MRPITADDLKALSAKANPAFVNALAEAMTDLMPDYEIDTPLRIQHFLAQAAHESDGFKTLKEYWGPTAAQKRYEGRKDLGNTKKGDGKRFMGRGIFQTTGRGNYQQLDDKFDLGVIDKPELLEEPHNAVLAACYYWQTRKLNALADRDDVLAITKKINGGTNGLEDRKRYLARAKKLFAGPAPKTVPIPTAPTVPVDPIEPMPPPTEPIIVTNTSPPEIIKSLQTGLNERNYPCGAADGKFGKLTRDAVLSFKADHDLDTSDASVDLNAVLAAEPRVIEARVEATEATLREREEPTVKGADQVQTTGVVAGGTAAVAGTLTWFETFSGWWRSVKTSLAEFGEPGTLFAWLLEHWYLPAMGGMAIGMIILARKARARKLEEFKVGNVR